MRVSRSKDGNEGNSAISIPVPGKYVYASACHEDEEELHRMELMALLGCEPADGCTVSGRNIDPGRSPFIRAKLTVAAEGPDIEAVAEYAGGLELGGSTFKVVFMETDNGITYEMRREAERQIGWRIRGKAEMRSPDRLYGVACVQGRWLFGEYEKSGAQWLKHNWKPQPYSTALGTRVARAVVNIAVPVISGTRLIDPCCGIGTVVIEALSMGVDVTGFDNNPLAVRGARVNLAHFGMPDVVRLADMRSLEGCYDAAIVDLPYNLCSVISAGERLEMLESARRLAGRIVIVTTGNIDGSLARAGLVIEGRCVVRKGRFERQIILSG
ncbi:RsmD family RNA methyltransferase [Paenibacillus sp. sptzw28]|nr:RsmD family RNA methyltransferase [Paenibacillus sp. sptzw28]